MPPLKKFQKKRFTKKPTWFEIEAEKQKKRAIANEKLFPEVEYLYPFPAYDLFRRLGYTNRQVLLAHTKGKGRVKIINAGGTHRFTYAVPAALPELEKRMKKWLGEEKIFVEKEQRIWNREGKY